VNLIERAAIYGACAFVVYLLQVSPGAAAEYGRYINVFYYVLAMAVAVGIRFSKPANFQATPLDYLVILIAVIVPNLPEFSADDSHLGELALKLIVLFYGSEMVISLKRGNWDMLRVGTISSLLVLGFRGLT
jgi:UDP-GlcNAc:undecaprenyl-phosphate GlcNAc-1-phosphate transferase